MSVKSCCKFNKNLYVGESIKNSALVRWKIKHGAGQLSIYVITGPSNESDQLEITHCAFLKQKYYRKHPVMVYGIAGSMDEAMNIVIKISDEAANCGMDGDIKGYLEKALMEE